MKAPPDPGFDPLMAKHRGAMVSAIQALERVFPGAGLCLFVFDQDAEGPRANYVGNAKREQTLLAVKEWVARNEAAQSAPGPSA